MTAAVLLVKALGGGWSGGLDAAVTGSPAQVADAPVLSTSSDSGFCEACIEIQRLWSLAGPYQD
jgi:hypothetical protein